MPEIDLWADYPPIILKVDTEEKVTKATPKRSVNGNALKNMPDFPEEAEESFSKAYGGERQRNSYSGNSGNTKGSTAVSPDESATQEKPASTENPRAGRDIKENVLYVHIEDSVIHVQTRAKEVLDHIADNSIRVIHDGADALEFPDSPLNAFVVSRYMDLMETVISDQDRASIESSAGLIPNPRVKIDTDTHVAVRIPMIKHYRSIMNAVNGFPDSKRKGIYKVRVDRVLDLEDFSNADATIFPALELDKEVHELNHEPIPGFDGSLDSLRDIKLDALNVINANIQSWGAKKKSDKTMTEKLAEFGVESLHDLMMYLPMRYIDKSNPRGFDDLIEGETMVLVGTIVSTGTIMHGRGGAKFTIADAGGKTIPATFFNQAWLLNKFKEKDEVMITGKMKWFQRKPQVAGESIEIFSESSSMKIVPIYKQAPSKGITTKLMMAATREMMSRIGEFNQPPYLDLSEIEDIMAMHTSLEHLHFPASMEEHKDAMRSMGFYEMIYLQMSLKANRRFMEARQGVVSDVNNGLTEDAEKSLPFTLTDGQKKSVAEIHKKMERDYPSTTLLTADVGSGKGLSADELVATPEGVTTIGSLKIGDKVIGSNGAPTTVTGVFPRGQQKAVRVRFNDGSSIVTDTDHLWTVLSPDDTHHALVSSGSMLEEHRWVWDTVERDSRWHLPVISAPIQYVEGARIEGMSPLVTSPWKMRIAYIIAAVQELAEDKTFINGNTLVTGQRTAHDIAFTVRSFGGWASQPIEYKGQWSTTIYLPLDMAIPATLTLQKDGQLLPGEVLDFKPLQETTVMPPHRQVVMVERVDDIESICIKVDANDELFVTGKDLIVTHNTVVAQLSSLKAVEAGHQVAFLAPTEILAQQLFTGWEKLRDSMKGDPDGEPPFTVEFISGSMKAKEKKEILARVKSGETKVLVSTHAILTGNIEFHDLGMVVIDEQQKFGTDQRNVLLSSRSDGKVPDLLLQTATPIPRSAAQAFYGDIDLIELKDRPAGRIPIKTEWVQENPQEIIEHITSEIWADVISEAEQGRQTFIITPLVFDSTTLEAASVERSYQSLSKMALSSLRVGMVHGKMKKAEQQEIMNAFRNKEYDVLVASTVVEVGVDVPNATRIIVLSAERLGASSLHQIRGRVGRGKLASKCYLVSNAEGDASQNRLQSLVDTEDGFEIAMIDMASRGEGSVLGTNQSGMSNMIFASLAKNRDQVYMAQQIADEILDSEYGDIAMEDSKKMFGDTERLM